MKPIALLGEAYGTNEEKIRATFVGASGLELLRMLNEAGVITLTTTDNDYIRKYWTNSDPLMLDMVWRLHPEVIRLNVFNLHAPGNNIATLLGDKSTAIPGYPPLEKGTRGYVRKEFAPHLQALASALNAADCNVVVALGNTPLWALCGTTGVSKLRGTTRLSTHTVADFKVLSTYHPSAVLRQIELKAVTIFDLMKAKRENESPALMLPKREIWIEPTVQDIEAFYDQHIRGCDLLSVDIETSGNQVTCIGFAPSRSLALVIPFYDARKPNRSYWNTLADEQLAWRNIKSILGDRTIPKLFQNGLYDIAFLARSVGIKTYGAVHDTMLLHHALQPESLKSLEFLGSVYTNEGAWKRDHRTLTNKRGS